MSADVEEVEGQVVRVEPVVAEHVAGELCGRDELPRNRDRALDEGRGEQRLDVAGGAVEFGGHFALRFGELSVRLVSLQEVDVPARVVPHAGDDFEPVGEFDEVVVGPQRERSGLHDRFFLARKDHERGFARRGVGAEVFDELEPVDVGHHEVLEDDGGPELVGRVDGGGGIGAEAELDAGLVGEHSAHRFADHRLVIDE